MNGVFFANKHGRQKSEKKEEVTITNAVVETNQTSISTWLCRQEHSGLKYDTVLYVMQRTCLGSLSQSSVHVKSRPPSATRLRTRGHQLWIWINMNSTNETLLFVRFLIMYNLCVFACIIFIFVFHCTHVRMSYVLNSFLLTYLLTSSACHTCTSLSVTTTWIMTLRPRKTTGDLTASNSWRCSE